MGENNSKPEESGHRHDSQIQEDNFSTDNRSTAFPLNTTYKPKFSVFDDNRKSLGEVSQFSYGQAFNSQLPTKDMRQIGILLPSGKKETIYYSIDDDLTVGWLYSEYWRVVSSVKELPPARSLTELVLCTANKDLNLDYNLGDYSEKLDFLPEHTLIKPFKGYEVNEDLGLKDFTIIKNIGAGGFSKVCLVRRNDNGRFYALKFVNKRDLGKSGKEEYAFNEKKLLAKLRNKFINRFVFSFQTPVYLCFGLEYCEGGCLYDILKSNKSFDEEVVRICIAQIALAMSYLHSKGVIYRDLKAENILIDKRGNCKLCDFGLSKKVENIYNLNETFCGSPEYLAPEVIQKKGYNCMRDIFSLGILTYELLHGYTPFTADDQREIYSNILKEDCTVKMPVSPECRNFIEECLKKNPHQRLGCVSGIGDVLSHPWLRTIVYNIRNDTNKQAPFQAFVPKKQIVAGGGESVGMVNEYYQATGGSNSKQDGSKRYFDFSFRLSKDDPGEYPDIEDTYPDTPDLNYFMEQSPYNSNGSSGKIRMASNINIIS